MILSYIVPIIFSYCIDYFIAAFDSGNMSSYARFEHQVVEVPTRLCNVQPRVDNWFLMDEMASKSINMFFNGISNSYRLIL